MMNILKRLTLKKKTGSAPVAKERLQIILAHERAQVRSNVDLQKLKEEILDVLKKYVSINHDSVHVHYQNQEGFSVLELNVTLPESTP